MAALTETQVSDFRKNGYLVIEDVLATSSLDALHNEYDAILNREVPRLLTAGKIVEGHSGLPFVQRYPLILAQLQNMYDLYQHLDISLPLLHKMAPDATMNAGAAVFQQLLRNPTILDIAESLLGSELFCNPVQHTRIKPPLGAMPKGVVDSNIDKTNWHQDEAVLSDDVGDVQMLTVWVAVTDASVENGCMVCVPGSHRRDMAMHCPGNGFSSAEIFIPDDLIGQDEVVAMPVKKGGVVLLDQQTIHGSLSNTSNQTRWSFDLRYNVIGQNTGREVFPGFVARSAANPASELTDVGVWAQSWFEARDRLALLDRLEFNDRWKRYSKHQLCA